MLPLYNQAVTLDNTDGIVSAADFNKVMPTSPIDERLRLAFGTACAVVTGCVGGWGGGEGVDGSIGLTGDTRNASPTVMGDFG